MRQLSYLEIGRFRSMATNLAFRGFAAKTITVRIGVHAHSPVTPHAATID
jgi:hypothetical protein